MAEQGGSIAQMLLRLVRSVGMAEDYDDPFNDIYIDNSDIALDENGAPITEYAASNDEPRPRLEAQSQSPKTLSEVMDPWAQAEEAKRKQEEQARRTGGWSRTNQ